MKDQSNTKQILMRELASLKQRIDELEQSESVRKREEETLRESEGRYRRIAENMSDIVSEVDAQGIIRYASPSYQKLFGEIQYDVTGRSAFDSIHPEDKDRVAAEYMEGVRTKTAREVEYRVRHADGHYIWLRSVGHPFFGAAGERLGMIVTSRDITERRWAEEAQRESEVRFAAIFNTQMNGIVIIDSETKTIIDANVAALHMIGATREDVIGQECHKFICPTERGMCPITDLRMDLDNSERVLIRADHTKLSILKSVSELTLGSKNYLIESFIDITERQRAEAVLHEQENKLSSIFRAAPVGIGMVINRMFHEVNDTLCRMTGYSREELLDRDARMLYPTQEDYDYVGQEKYRQIGEKLIGTVETRWRRKDGTVIEIILSSTPLNPDHLAKGVTFTALDITDRKRMEEALRQSEANYRQLFDNSPSGIYQVDFRTGKFIKANDAMCQYLGYRQEEIPSLSPYDVLTDESKQLFAERINKMNLGEKVVENPEFEIMDKEGKRRWVQLSTKFFYDSEGLAGADVVAHEITDRKLVETELRESEKRYRTLIDFLPISIFEIDTTGIIASFNRNALKAFRYNEGDFKEGMNALQFFVPKEWQRVGESMRKVIQRTSIPGQEFTFVRKDGTTFVGLIYSSPIVHQNNTIGIRGAIIDITDRKRADEEKRQLGERLQRSEKMEALGQLAGGVAHDLNNVLGVLTGYSELLLGEIPEGQRSRGYAEKILQSTEKGAAIIQDLLTLARRGLTASDVVNLNGVVSDFLKTPVFEKLKDYHPHVTFRTECDSNLLNIKGSPVHLEKTLMNLVSNAAESISGKGEVTIRTESRYLDKLLRGYDEVKEGDYAVLTVSDTGMGIPVENREKIFEPFYTKKTMGRSGTGLGLAIVWGTVKDHNGYIDLQTEVGKGTTFTLYFPVTQEDLIAQQQKMPIERYMGKGESVLVVDDIAEQRDIAARLLTRLGYSVRVVSSGEEAVEYLRGNKADILVLDMIMAPGMDGLETYQRVLSIYPKQKAILVSGFSETDRVKKAQRLGAGAYVKKPYVIEKIGVTLRDELNRK